MVMRKWNPEAASTRQDQIFLGYVVYSPRSRRYLLHRRRTPTEAAGADCCHPGWAHRYQSLAEAMDDAMAWRDQAEVLILADQDGGYRLHRPSSLSPRPDRDDEGSRDGRRSAPVRQRW
ncbi:hypothetical protein [Alloalcanivorax profundimaris]|uniref:hypothetical protein n=1 Tax=Alloalcanivorax profundimaris TaxID=2735259 RepID=UPI0018912169|nr:hypothetical protein [Alloalcanivorax profundimaris]